MPRTPEDDAREQIDSLLADAGWVVQHADAMNIGAARGVAVREFQLARGHGRADYLLYADRKALGVIEAKAEGTPLTGMEVQAERYAAGMPANLPVWHRPLPFVYLSTGAETLFTSLLDPSPRSRQVFSFHRPETLSVVDELEALVAANLKRAGRLRQAILKRAFEGRLVPQTPNDEPAGVLLERIRREREADPGRGTVAHGVAGGRSASGSPASGWRASGGPCRVAGVGVAGVGRSGVGVRWP